MKKAPGPPPESESGRASDKVERDVGTDAWQVHAKSEDEPLQAEGQQPTEEWAAEAPAPGEQDNRGDSG